MHHSHHYDVPLPVAISPPLTGSGLRRKLLRFLDDRDVPTAATSLDEALALWSAASESYQVEIDLASQRPDSPPDDHAHPDDHAKDASADRDAMRLLDGAEITRLQAQRDEFARRCAEAYGRTELEERARFCLHGASDLIDYSGAVLTDVAGAHPQRRVLSLRALRRRIDFFPKSTWIFSFTPF